MNDRVLLCADAVARWHASWLTALGIPWERDADAWRAVAPPHVIYFAAITLRPETSIDALVHAPGSICDNWQAPRPRARRLHDLQAGAVVLPTAGPGSW